MFQNNFWLYFLCAGYSGEYASKCGWNSRDGSRGVSGTTCGILRVVKCTSPSLDVVWWGPACRGGSGPTHKERPTLMPGGGERGFWTEGGWAAGVCGVPVELLKTGGESMTRWMCTVIVQIWSTGFVPPDWRRRLVTPIYKGRGDQLGR